MIFLFFLSYGCPVWFLAQVVIIQQVLLMWVVETSEPPSCNMLSYISFGTPLPLTKKLKAFLIEFLQGAYFGTLLTLPVILQLLSQLLQFMLPSLFNLPPNLQRNAPLLLSHLLGKKKKVELHISTYIHLNRARTAGIITLYY